MHIAIISHLFYPDKIGDPFNAFEFATKLVERGHKVSVVTWNMNKPRSPEPLSENLIIYRLEGFNLSFGRTITEYPYLPSISKIIRELKPDVIHAQSHLFLTTLQSVFAAKKNKIPVLITVHGVIAKRGSLVNLIQCLYLHTIGRFLFKTAAKIICLTNSDAMEIEKFGCKHDKIDIIPNGVSAELFSPRQDFKGESIIWSGRFVPEKGVDHIIKAAKIVSKFHAKAKFMLVGDGPLKEKIARMVDKLGLQDVFIFTGKLPRAQLPEVLSNASLFVFPSLKEGLPLALLEAMSCEKAVIAYDIGGVNEVIQNGKNGILVEPHDIDTLSKRIMELLEDRLLAEKLGKEARRTILDHYGWDTVINKVEALYAKVRIEAVNTKKEVAYNLSPPAEV